MLQSMGLQRVTHDLATEQQQPSLAVQNMGNFLPLSEPLSSSVKWGNLVHSSQDCREDENVHRKHLTQRLANIKCSIKAWRTQNRSRGSLLAAGFQELFQA
ncbi:hypothetical protein U6Y41_12685, partial [Cutibacterium acnes]